MTTLPFAQPLYLTTLLYVVIAYFTYGMSLQMRALWADERPGFTGFLWPVNIGLTTQYLFPIYLGFSHKTWLYPLLMFVLTLIFSTLVTGLTKATLSTWRYVGILVLGKFLTIPLVIALITLTFVYK